MILLETLTDKHQEMGISVAAKPGMMLPSRVLCEWLLMVEVFCSLPGISIDGHSNKDLRQENVTKA